MAELAIGNRIYRHEAKPQPTTNAPGKVVEAFGLGKCPKLAEQVSVIVVHAAVRFVGHVIYATQAVVF